MPRLNLLSFALAALIVTPVFAQDDAKPTDAPEGTEARQGKKGKKGKKARKARRKALKKKFDANGDGKLDETERAALKEAMKARRAKMKERMISRVSLSVVDSEKATRFPNSS